MRLPKLFPACAFFGSSITAATAALISAASPIGNLTSGKTTLQILANTYMNLTALIEQVSACGTFTFDPKISTMGALDALCETVSASTEAPIPTVVVTAASRFITGNLETAETLFACLANHIDCTADNLATQSTDYTGIIIGGTFTVAILIGGLLYCLRRDKQATPASADPRDSLVP